MKRKALRFVCAVIVGSLATVAYGFQVVETHLLTIQEAPTPWVEELSVPRYDPANHNGQPLMEVRFTLVGDAMSSVDIISNGGRIDVLGGDVGAFITADGSVTGLSLNALPSGQFAPPMISVESSQTVNLTDVSGSDADELTMTSGLNPYVGTGSYVVEVDAIGTSSLTTSGGNYDLSQRTEAGAQLKVEYAIVPEPGAMALGGLGLLAVLWWRRS